MHAVLLRSIRLIGLLVVGSSMLSGCSTHKELLTQPMRIGPTWAEIQVRPALEARLRSKNFAVDIQQGIGADLPPESGQPHIVNLSDGRRVMIFAELVTSDKTTYP